ncbi:DUF5787 family protein [Halopenitus sp. POP-27]|uniref:DUF5787 family protein n=1 Tax=Halopenitus sp. POP-27 TaxID=2994425 RepID=UPI0024687042|nr:DUF5787 family protein [Halopenitus sp. POP-27]
MVPSPDSEFGFELALCAVLEKPDRVVARQLGGAVARPGARVVDVCMLEPGPGFADRTSITPATIPDAALAADVGPGTAVPIADAFDLSPDRARSVADAAVDAGYLERERRDGRDLVRATARYPDDWVGELVAIENKPDLDRPGDLRAQLRFDVELGLFDRVWLATASHVTRAHLNRIPMEVGVQRADPETGDREVVRETTALPVADPGIEIVAAEGLRTDVEVVTPAAKSRKRRRIAERAYGKGWRPDPPGCAHASTTPDGRPYCDRFDRVVDPGRDCGNGCTAYDPADPPRTDHRALRAANSAWVADPDRAPRRQTGLDRFE